MFDLIEKRRSIRKFEEKPIEKEKIKAILQGMLLAPTSRDKKPWQFVVVKDKAILEKLAEAKHGAAFLKGAAMAIVVCADPDKSDVWIEDASIASAYILLLAEHLNLGACWVQIRKRMHNSNKNSEEYVKEILDIPNKIRIESIIAIGYKQETKEPKSISNIDNEKIFLNKYGFRYND